MKQLVNEFVVFYSKKLVWILYLVVPTYVFLLDYLLKTDGDQLLMAPGIVAQSTFGSLYGVVVVLLTAMVWEQDLKGEAIKNVFSAGISRHMYCSIKMIFTFFIDIILSAEVSLAGVLILFVKGDIITSLSHTEIIKCNVCSFFTILLVSITYSIISTIVFLLLKNYIVALLISGIIPFLETVVTLSVYDSSNLILSPFGFFLRSIDAVEVLDVTSFFVVTMLGALIMTIYIVIGIVLSFVVCIKRAY